MKTQICRAIFEEICVLANGEVVCSCGDPSGLQVYGNVKEQAIEDIFRSRAYQDMRKYQLEGEACSYCPVIGVNCGGRVYAGTPLHTEYGLSIKKIQLEPISSCNLDCPECPVHNFELDERYRPNRQARMSLSDMIAVIEQLPALELILYYNFGEPFLHSDSIEFLRAARSIRPNAQIHTSTNGIPLTDAMIETIARERLLDTVVFSIDGATQSSYEHYRRTGDFHKAFGNLIKLRKAIRAHNAERDIQLLWQYILFEWNDSDEEIALAKALAREHDLPMMWILTHTNGKSLRYTHDSAAYRELVGQADSYRNLTCELQELDLAENGMKGHVYAAEINIQRKALGKNRISMEVSVTNTSRSRWDVSDSNPYRLGLKFLDKGASTLWEAGSPGIFSPIESGESALLKVDVPIPVMDELTHVLVDVLHSNVCWFHDRGVTPIIVPVNEFNIM